MPKHRTGTASITLCVCSARPALVAAKLAAWREALAPGDELLVVFDTPVDATQGWPYHLRGRPGPRVRGVWLGATRGLSRARMRGLELAGSQHVVFMDDDAIASVATLEAIRRALEAGARAVGVRLQPSFESCARPWRLTDGVLHFVGVHSESTLGSVWGACFGVDRDFAREHAIGFRPELGRCGRQLQSGDDSSFVQRIRECDGPVVFLPHSLAVHAVGPDKCSFRYLLRRAWWQGRSEVRRGDWPRGLGKELGRICGSGPALARLCVAPAFAGAVVGGIATELALSCSPAGRRRARAWAEAERNGAMAGPAPHGSYAYGADLPEPW